MSGFYALVHFEDRPLDREVLTDLTAAIQYRGPDGFGHWADRSVALGFAKRATTEEAVRETQPLTLDGRTWIVADARVDAREQLFDDLEARGREGVRSATDAELLLHAYAAWGEAAAEHLLGDFSFAIWDFSQRRLYCARDHFGVKPLFYAQWPGGVMVSNTLAALLCHPSVESNLNEAAIADFLMFGWNLDADTTSFRDVKRLAPAHTACWESRGRRIRRYWRLPEEPDPRLTADRNLIERFDALLRDAVRDRLRTPDVAIFLSGGLDSTSLAAVGAELTRSGENTRLICFTQGYDRLIADEEPPLARLVADRLGLAYHYRPMDDYQLAERWGEIPIPLEPGEHLYDALLQDIDRDVAGHSRVALTGYGGDVILLAETGYLGRQLLGLRLDRVARYLFGSFLRGQRPPLGLHSLWTRRQVEHHWRTGYPGWLNPDLERRLDLEERWRWFQLERRPESLHRTRPRAQVELSDLGWTNIFEAVDPGIRPLTVEQRHPFFDLRLVECLLSSPPVPWCLDKHLLRESMRGRLPEVVRRRKKTPWPEFPRHARAPQLVDQWLKTALVSSELARFARVRRALPSSFEDVLSTDSNRVLSLTYWLNSGTLH